MTDEARQRLVIEKARLLSEFRRLRRALEAYGELLARSDGDQWPHEAVTLLREQQLAMQEQGTSPGAGELTAALLQRVLRRVQVPEFRFEPRPEADAGAPAAIPGRAGAPPAGDLVASLQPATESAPLEMQETLHRVLSSIVALFAALGAGDAAGTDAAIARLNLGTANPQSRDLLREIAIVTRDIYNALQSVSEELPLDALSESSSGLTQAVQRLNSVIARLDEAATQNLDGLELVNRTVGEGEAELAGAIQALRDVQKRMMELKAEHPELEGPLTELQQRIADGVGGPAMTLAYHAGRNRMHHLELISNQSFQELTTRTLRKIIAFVESLELQLYELLRKYRPGGEEDRPAAPAAPEAASEAAVESPQAAHSQDDVDKLLGELGF